MLRVSCNDIGVLGCDFIAQGERPRKVESRMLQHVREVHPQLAAGLTFEQRTVLEARIASAMRASSTTDDRREPALRSALRMAMHGRSERLRLRRRAPGAH